MPSHCRALRRASGRRTPWRAGDDICRWMFELGDKTARVADDSDLVPHWMAPGKHRVERPLYRNCRTRWRSRRLSAEASVRGLPGGLPAASAGRTGDAPGSSRRRYCAAQGLAVDLSPRFPRARRRDPQRVFIESWSRRIGELDPDKVADDARLWTLVTEREWRLIPRWGRPRSPMIAKREAHRVESTFESEQRESAVREVAHPENITCDN